jgi:hypothetical protein
MAAHGTLSAYNNDQCRCPRCREAARTAKARYRGGEGASQRPRPVKWEAVESEPGPVEFEPTWQPDPIELEDSYEQRPATWRKRARRRSGGSSRETAVRNLRELVRTREDVKAQQATAPAVRLAAVQVAPVQAPTLGPGFQEARRRGEPTGFTYSAEKVAPGRSPYLAPLRCGHSVPTPVPMAEGHQLFCSTCQRMVLVGLAVSYAAPPKPARQRRGRRVRLPRAPAQDQTQVILQPMAFWQ